MNVTGVSGAAVTPPIPTQGPTQVPAPVRPAAPADPVVRQAKHDTQAAAAAAQQAALAAAQQRQAQEKLPPLKPLSTTEMRVILGAIPPSQLNKRTDNGQGTAPGSTFDAYA